MKLKFLIVLSVNLLMSSAFGEDHRLEAVEEAVPADVSQEISAALVPQATRVIQGESRTVFDVWLRKELAATPDFNATNELLYPFEPGQLIGVLRFKRRGSDFRDQTISRGVYTLRYGLQPVDGNHVGTSPTRDFLVMVKAEEDTHTGKMEYEKLVKASAEAAQSSHPAMLCLQKPRANAKALSIRHDEDHDWWIATLASKAAGRDETITLELVVAGHAAE